MANSPLKVIVERNVPYLEVLDSVARIKRLPYQDINANAVRDADALIVRTRNRCDAELLEGSAVSFIGTATIGTDHIDLKWCAANGIRAVNAPGCNAPAVAQYVFSSLMRVINRPVSQYTIGIVGVGHVGSIVERWARGLGMRVLLCDPPRQEAGDTGAFTTIEDIAKQADIITFHTPYTREGRYATHHLADETFFNSLRRAPIIINSARGPIVDNRAWAEAIAAGVCGAAIVDCWEGEPQLYRPLLERAAVATPHIAGYSAEGKRRASQAVLTAFCRHFGLPELYITGPVPPQPAHSVTAASALNLYNPLEDTASLRANPDAFEVLRNTYRLRDELPDTHED